MVIAYNPNVGGGLASGAEKLANAFLERKRRQGIASGLEQINGGDWEGGINTISEADPDTALNLTLAKRKSDDAMALEQAKEQARNTITPYQQEMINLARQRLAQSGGGTGSIKNIEYLVGQGYTPEQAANMVFSGQNPTLDVATLGIRGQEAYDKKIGEALADKEQSERQTRKLSPITQRAINDARGSLKQGDGLGQVGGIGWTTGQGGKNRENVARAQRAMNIQIRGALKEVGVGSKELDAAAEAEAYRAKLDPRLPLEQQEQILDNFEADYLSGKLHQELAEAYGKPQEKTVQIQAPDGRIVEVPESEVQNAIAQGGRRI